jgi:predicted lipoprotein
LLFVGCDGQAEVSPRRRTLLSLTDHVFVPMLEDFTARADELACSAQALCEAPDAERLAATRAAWHAARAGFKRTEVMAFGPHTLAPWRLAPQLDFWPVRPDSVEQVLASDVELATAERLDQVGAAARGLPAIEYLLFDEAALSALADDRRCQYVAALGRDLGSRARELRRVFVEDYAPELLLQSDDGRYASINEAFGEVVNSLAFAVEVVRDEKLGRPLGLRSGGEPQPDAVESPFAARSLQDALDALDGVTIVFTGRYGDRAAEGVGQLLRERGESLDGTFELHMQGARSALEAIDVPLREAVVDRRPRVQAAIDALRELLIFLQVDLTQALSVTVTFGGADGD